MERPPLDRNPGRGMSRRLTTLKLFSWLLLFFCLALGAAPGWTFHSPDMPKDLERLRENCRLRVSILALHPPPFVFEENGKLVGADVDIARDMAAKIGV